MRVGSIIFGYLFNFASFDDAANYAKHLKMFKVKENG
jgi:hypothetical protein